MKKIILFALLSISAFSIAQEVKVKEVQSFRKNEVKLNALFLILGAFEGTYERSVNTESAFGVSLTFLLDNQNDVERAFAISPYYRLYFGKKPVSGFFVEGFGLYQAVSNETYYYNFDPNSPSNNTVVTEKVKAFALGIGLGGKWYTKSNILFEINAGIGRNLSISSNVQNSDYSRITGKFSLGIGYRF